jgi:hypothetical protein
MKRTTKTPVFVPFTDNRTRTVALQHRRRDTLTFVHSALLNGIIRFISYSTYGLIRVQETLECSQKKFLLSLNLLRNIVLIRLPRLALTQARVCSQELVSEP